MAATHSLLRLVQIATALCFIAVVGCSGPYDATVYGIVMLDGQPVPRGTVMYYPTGSAPTASARIEDDGSYNVQTGSAKGIMPGEYQVTVIANEPSAESEGSGPPPLGKAIVPPRYRSKATSGLKFRIAPGSNEIDLKLSSEPAGNSR